MSESLPTGWSWSTLSTVARIAANLVDPADWSDLPHIAPDNIERDTGKLLPYRTIGEDGMTSAKHRFYPGQLLYSKIRPYLNKCVRVDFDGLCSADMYPLDPFVEPSYLHPYMLTRQFVSAVSAAAGSRTVLPKTNQKQLANVPVPVAPQAEQRRIVEAIESYLTRLDDAVATLERVQRNLKRYRASVLKAAVEGRLVPTEAELARAEGRDYEPASVLLKRIHSERRRRWEEAELAKMKAKGKTPTSDKWKAKYKEPVAPDTDDLPELPEGWCWACMDQVVWAIEAGKSFRCVERPPGPGQIGVVKVSSVTWGTFDEDESKTCTRPELVNPDYFIQPGDFLISRANTIELVGAAVVVGPLSKTLMLSDKILRLRAVGDLERWLLWVLRTSHGRNEIESLATGNQDSMRNIGQANIRRIRVPLPPFLEARRIIESIDEQCSTTEHGEGVVGAAEARCNRLRQAILKWAFEGKLVDQDQSDEPAAALLDRIAAKRGVVIAPDSPHKRARNRTGSAKT